RSRGADQEGDFPQANKAIAQQFALYYGGKIAGKLGTFAQYNWDGIEKKWGAEMVDIRYADSTTVRGKELLYGVSLSNSPSVQDVWNTSPMWSFPHLSDAGIMPMETSLMDMTLANQVGGVGLYGFYDSQFYGEIGFFRNGKKGIFKALNLGKDLTTAIKDNAPHVRLALEKNWGPHNLEVGMHLLRADIFPDPDNQSGPTNRFTDAVLDSQYQYIGGDHIFSLQAFYDHEKRSWDASFPAGDASNASDNLNTLKLSGHYWYKRKLGGGIGYFDYRGDTDRAKYRMSGMGMPPSAMNNVAGNPDTRGWIVEANWLPLENEQNLRLGLRYTAYTKFNGAASNYNGAGRNASDNNAIFTYAWLLF
ncbi:MAG: cytochrome C, partial [Burkholderiales bacterium]